MMKKDIIKIGRRLNITVDEWSGLVAEFHQSKLTLPDFAKNKGINPYTFRYWAYDRARLKRNRDKTKNKQMAFVEISPSVKNNLAIEVRFPNGVQVNLSSTSKEDISFVLKEVATCLD